MMRDACWATGDARHGWWFATGIVALVAFGGCHRGAAHADGIAKAAPAAHVKTVLVTEEKIPRFIFATGSLAPAQQTEVAAGIPSTEANRSWSTCQRAGGRCSWNEMLRISDEECPSEERGSSMGPPPACSSVGRSTEPRSLHPPSVPLDDL
jgi:hypothetical protein